MPRFVRRAAMAACLVAAVVVPVTSASSATTAAPQFASVDGLTVQAVQQLDARALPSGVYFVKMESRTQSVTRKITILK